MERNELMEIWEQADEAYAEMQEALMDAQSAFRKLQRKAGKLGNDELNLTLAQMEQYIMPHVNQFMNDEHWMVTDNDLGNALIEARDEIEDLDE